MQCMATKKKYLLTKEGSKKNRRVYSRNMEGTEMGKKTEKGKGKEKNRRNAKGMKKRMMRISAGQRDRVGG